MILSKIHTHYIDLSLLKNNCIIIDGGSSYGKFTEEMIKEFNKNNINDYKVFSIECSKKNIKILEENKNDKIKIYNMALCGQDEEDLIEFKLSLNSAILIIASSIS